MRTSMRRRPVTWLVLVAIALEIVIIPFFFILGLDATIDRAVTTTGIDLRSDLLTITRIVVEAPYAWLAAALSIAQVAAPDLALLIVVGLAFGAAGLDAVRRRFRFWSHDVGWRRGLLIWLALVVTFLGMGAATAGLSSLFLADAGFTWSVQPLTVGFAGAVLVAMFLDAGGLFEENAWRGFALPWLQAHRTPVVAAVILGVLWSAWHVPVKLPLILDYGLGGFAVMFGVLTLKFVLLSIVMAYFFNRAGAATLTAVAGHGLSNDSMGIGGVIASEAFADQVTYELLLVAPMGVAALVLVATTRGRLGLTGSAPGASHAPGAVRGAL